MDTKRKELDRKPKSKAYSHLVGTNLISELILDMEYLYSRYNAGDSTVPKTSTEIGKKCKTFVDRLEKRVTDKEWGLDSYSKNMSWAVSAISANFVRHNASDIFTKDIIKIQKNHFKDVLEAADLTSFTAFKTWHAITKEAILNTVGDNPRLEKDGEKALKWIAELRDRIVPFALEKLRQKDKYKRAIKDAHNERVQAYNDGVAAIHFTPDTVLNSIEKLLSLKHNEQAFIPDTSTQSDNLHYKNGHLGLTLGIMFATGRRMYEVLYLTEFKAVSKNKIQLKNLAKKPAHLKDSVYTIETFYNAYQIARAWRYLRSTPQVENWKTKLDETVFYERNKKFNSFWSPQLNTAARSIFTDGFKNPKGKTISPKAKDLRDLYVMILFNIHKNINPDLQFQRFVHNHLLHESTITAESYAQYRNDKMLTIAEVEQLTQWTHEQRKDTRVEDFTNLLEREDIKKSKALTMIATEIIKRVKREKTFTVSSYTLQNWYGKDQPKKGIASPVTVTRFMKIVRHLDINCEPL